MPQVRAATDDDLPAVLDLLAASLGWVPGSLYERYFRWKHLENPYGRSAMLVADDNGRIVALRAFLRWELVRDGEVLRVVRAVDTATHPDAQGKGLFTTLTMHALDLARGEGVPFVFNTPNTQSRPGYLKMGWHDVGRLPVRVRPRSLTSLPRIAAARVPAERWSLPADAGLAAKDAFADEREIERLLAAVAPATTRVLRTNRTPRSLAWRYGFEALAYRVVPIADRVGDGLVVFRLRRRGAAVEATISDVIAPPDSSGVIRRALSRVLRETRADYAIALGPARRAREGLVRLPGQGPRLTWRAVCEDTPPALTAFDFALADAELL